MTKSLRSLYLTVINWINKVKFVISGERRNYVYSNIFPVLRNRRTDVFEQISAKVRDRGVIYAMGIGLVLLAFLAKIWLDPIFRQDETVFLLSFVAVVITSLSGGAKPGIFTTLLVAIGAIYMYFTTNTGKNFWEGAYLNQIRMFTFLFEGVFVSLLIGRLKESEERAVLKSKLLINSEKHLRNVLNSLYAFVGVMTINGILIECNNAMLDVAALDADDVLGKPLDKTYWWNFAPSSKKKLVKAIKKAALGNLVRYDAKMRIGKHKYIVVDLTIAPIRNDEGKIIYLIPSGVDVTQKMKVINDNKKLYSELDDEKRRLEHIVGNTPGVVWEVMGKPFRKNQELTYISDYIDIILGCKKEERINDKDFWLRIIHPEDRDRVIRESEIIYNSGEGGSSRYRWVTKKGKIIWVETRMVLIKDFRGTIVGTRGVTVDITDRISLEQRKDEFTSIASHELKTPLTTIKAFTQILEKKLEKTGDKELLGYIGKMNNYIGRLTKIIYDFLDFSKIQAGRLDLFREDCDMIDLTKEVVEDLQSTTETHKILLKADDTKAISFADRNRISQVLINLITNAIKYSPEADKIEVSARREGDEVIVWVKDYGVGIPKENQSKIFDRFYRVNQPKKIKIEGFGLGLYISWEIVQRHKGRIWFDSIEGEGSTFYFALPIKK